MPRKNLDYGRLSWDHDGRAWWEHNREVPCVGSRYTGKHIETSTDEYGTDHHCDACTYGSGRTMLRGRVRVPRYDAPRPPKSWKGPGKKKIEALFS